MQDEEEAKDKARLLTVIISTKLGCAEGAFLAAAAFLVAADIALEINMW